MHFLLIIFFPAVFFLSCSQSTEEAIIPPESVEAGTLASLIQEQDLPRGFAEAPANPSAPSAGAITLGRPSHSAVYVDAEGSILMLKLAATGSSSIPIEATRRGICRRWLEETAASSCPIKDATPMDVGYRSRAYSSDGPSGEAMISYVFVRHGILVTLIQQGVLEKLRDANTASFPERIDEAIQELAKQ